MMIAAICFFTAASVVHGAVGGDPMTTVKSTVNQALLRDLIPWSARNGKIGWTVSGSHEVSIVSAYGRSRLRYDAWLITIQFQ
jgi:hypothetical protein